MLLLSLTLAGCTSLKDAVMNEEANFVEISSKTLGLTKMEEIQSRFGQPDEINKRWLDGYDSEVHFYKQQLRQNNINQPLNTQTLVCEYNKGVLMGYLIKDTSLVSGPGFDNQDRPKLIRQKTTRQELQLIFGQPTLKTLLPSTLSIASLSLRNGGSPIPLVKTPEGTAEVWQYVNEVKDFDGEVRARRTLTVFFDREGIFQGSTQTQELGIGG